MSSGEQKDAFGSAPTNYIAMAQAASITLPFENRRQAGRILARFLENYASRDDVVVVGLARGGIPVAYEVALALRLPLDIIVVRKLGVPGEEELAMGAITSGGIRILNIEVIDQLSDAERVLREVMRREQQILEERESLYRDDRPPVAVDGKTVILVDDGLATGATMRAAVAAMKQREIARCVVAVPIGTPDACHHLTWEADEVICIAKPKPFHGVGRFYRDFSQIRDAEVRDLLAHQAPPDG